MDSNSIPSSEETPQSQASVQSSNRMKTDITWKYVTEVDDGGGTHKLKVCVFCGKGFRGGGINRMKQHLAGIRGQVASCLKVPADVRCIMKNAYDESVQAPKGISVEIDDGQTPTSQQARVKRKVSSTSKSPLENNYNACQPSIKSVWNSKERVHDTDLAVAMWFYHSCIPMNAANSPYFPIAMSKVASMGHGYTGPSYHALRVTLLKDAKTSVGLIVEGQRRMWSETGCTIMSDGWRDSRQRPLINFLVYCPRGISFVRSVDASDIESNAENLCNLFSDIVDYESIDKTDVWIIDEEAEGELDYDELESMLEEEPPSNNGASNSQTHDEDYALNDDVIELDDIVEDIVQEDNDNDDFDAL